MFKNEKILLTGANSGIGLSFAKKLRIKIINNAKKNSKILI